MILCTAMLFGNVQQVSAAYYDSGQNGTSWEDAYIISSAEDLRTLRDRVNSGEESYGKYYVLESDIDLSAYSEWIPIGITAHSFTGHFDGQEHTVTIESVTSDDAGLFGYLYARGNEEFSVMNLNIAGSLTGNIAGGICRTLLRGLIVNCSFNGTISASSVWAGGIAASIRGDSCIRSCTVNAEISSAFRSGGIAGYMSGGKIENCTVENGTKISASSASSYVGGIVGVNEGGSLSGNTWPSGYKEAGSSTPLPKNTPDTWNGHRYEVITESLTWEQAKTQCESMGGHLATITSQAEQNIITSLVSSNQKENYAYWLGAYADDSGFWHWVTSEPFEKQYQNYASGQPDGSGRYLQIFAFTDNNSSLYVLGKWDDTTNDGTNAGLLTEHGYICEWDNEPEQVKAAPVASSFREWLTNPEFREASYGAIPSPINTSHLMNNPPRITASAFTVSALRASEALPAQYDGREAIGLSEARNQGSYDTCWAFASLGALEASYRKQKMTVLGEYPDFSELHLAWYAYKTIYSKDIDPEYSILNQGGTPEQAANFLRTAETAPVKESEMPYSAAGNSDSDVEAFTLGKTFTKSAITLRETIKAGQIGEENIEMIKGLIMEYGAVYFHYYHSSDGYNEANHSFYSTRPNMTHAVMLVGWDDDYPAGNFRNTPERNGAWLVRNSWGKDWGDGGYFWMSYEQAIQSVMDNCYVFIASEDISAETKEQHKHDDGGETKNITPRWSANIFRAERNESIVSITFNTTDNNAEYQVYVNNLGKDKPSDPGSAVDEPVLSGVMPYAGYHTLNLELWETIRLALG